MPVSDFAITTLANIKEALAISDTNTARDGYLERQINRVSAAIDSYCLRPIAAREFQEDIDGTGGNNLVLDRGPIQEVLKLLYRYARTHTTDFFAYSEDYRESIIIDGNRLRLQNYTFFQGVQNFRIEYVAGWGEIDVSFSNHKLRIRIGSTPYTLYIPAGRQSAWDIADFINRELEDLQKEHNLSEVPTAKFDFRKDRAYTLQQDSGSLALLASESDSILPSLGFGNSDLTGQLSYTGSAVTLGVPLDIEEACIEMIANQFEKTDHGRGTRVIKQERVAGYSVTFQNDTDNKLGDSVMPDSVKRILDRYKLYPV